jgi:hypothetical protein
MSYNAPVYRVFIATPSDVEKEREKIRLAIHKVNEDFSNDGMFMPVMYEQLPPAAGVAPQQTINKKALRNCDVLIALFWTKIGKGTKDELIEHLNSGKYAMVYKLHKGAIPSDVAGDKAKSKDYREMEKFFNEAKTQKGNELGLFKEIKSGRELLLCLQEDLRRIRPFLADMTNDLLDETTVESDWLMEVEDEDILADLIPKYKVPVSRNLVLKVFDHKREQMYGDSVWEAILQKFCERNGSINLARVLVGLSQRGKENPEIYNHFLFQTGVKQLYERRTWMYVNFMKKLFIINKNEFIKLLSAEWFTDEKIKQELIKLANEG